MDEASETVDLKVGDDVVAYFKSEAVLGMWRADSDVTTQASGEFTMNDLMQVALRKDVSGEQTEA